MSASEHSTSNLGRPLRRSSSVLLSMNPSKWSLFSWRRSSALEAESGDSKAQTQKQEEAWEQAWLNALAFAFLFIAGGVFLAVYYILEPFLQPLLWAALIGTLLHPFKHTGTSRIKQWLQYLESSNVPLSVGLVLFPAFFFNWCSHTFEYYVGLYWGHLLLSSAGMVCLTAVYALSLPIHLYRVVGRLAGVLQTVSNYMSQTSHVQVGGPSARQTKSFYYIVSQAGLFYAEVISDF